MTGKDNMRPSGLSMLSPEELVKYEGKCLGIVEGKVAFADKDAGKVLTGLLQVKNEDKVFTCVPKAKATLVKRE